MDPSVHWIPMPNTNRSAAAYDLNFAGELNKPENKKTPINKNSKTNQVGIKCSH